MNTIKIERDLRNILPRVNRPGRYTGGEYGSVVKEGEGLLRVAVSYPDLYEIGMSNLAVRILYRHLNALEGVACERVFAPAPDFEAALKEAGLPLYSLETGRPLREFDLVGFSIGYELTLTSLLAILQAGGVSLFSRSRGEGEPIVIAGGPAVTNPAPYGVFVDAVFIGEAESWAAEIFPRLAEMKKRGASRGDLLAELRAHPSVWYPGKTEPTRRAVWQEFGDASPWGDSVAGGAGALLLPSAGAPLARAPFPVSNIRAVQDQGVVEIMRGCPNGCRFCHAGIFYRPYRLREPELIARAVDDLVYGCGYREITLSSLSSADYPGIADLVEALTNRYRGRGVSFSLPSLRINSVTMDLMGKLAEVRKSGLTFAVETPLTEWQRGLNKEAPLERTIALLREARARGWKQAKFYFMVGLPVSGQEDESAPIIDFLAEVQRATRLNLNANVATFIPKPHTPFQWAAQLGEEEALGRIMRIKSGLRRLPIKLGYHSPFLSLLEAVISRGDERAGELAYRAFLKGARLDAWEEHVNWDLWREVLSETVWDVAAETCRERGLEEKLPWDGIELGATKKYLKAEWARARAGELTAACASDCGAPCGACGGGDRGARVKDHIGPVESVAGEAGGGSMTGQMPVAMPGRQGEPDGPGGSNRSERPGVGIGRPDAGADDPAHAEESGPADGPEERVRRVLFSFSKTGRAVYLSHLNVMDVFERALLRADYRAKLSEGYNPKPRLEFASPLPLGITGQGEAAAVELLTFDSAEAFIERVNRSLPDGFEVLKAREIAASRPGQKKQSLMALYWGADYRIQSVDGSEARALMEVWRRMEEMRRTAEARWGWTVGVGEGPAATGGTEAGEPAESGRAVSEAGGSPPGGALVRMKPSPGSVCFRLRQTEAGESSVLKWLRETIGVDPLETGLRVTRALVLAQGQDGRPAGYFERLG